MKTRSNSIDMNNFEPNKSGVMHWWFQRITAVALVPLSIWFICSITLLNSSDHATITEWLCNSINSILILLLVITLFAHTYLGLHVIIDDYVHGDTAKKITIFCVKCAVIASGLLCAISSLSIIFIN